jgi:hypothetical protein
MAYVAMRGTDAVNRMSRLHGDVIRQIFRDCCLEYDHDQEKHANIPPCRIAPPTGMANPSAESFWEPWRARVEAVCPQTKSNFRAGPTD